MKKSLFKYILKLFLAVLMSPITFVFFVAAHISLFTNYLNNEDPLGYLVIAYK